MSLFDDVMPPPEEPAIRTVREVLAEVKHVLDDAFPEVWVRGEITSFKLHGSSGHMYFALKDAEADATLQCVWFKFAQRGLRFAPQDGLLVEARGAFDLYAPRGSFQLRVATMRPAGIGALLVAFEKLKQRLAAEGLFDAARKRPLPRFPQAIGLVTSPTGAAIHDLLHVMRRRWPGRRIVLAPVPVQGEGAAAAIAGAIARLEALGGLDVIIVGRGGGSLEDLWAFNEEAVVRAVAASRVPVVSAVGHEVDVTLCDLVADVRAATPSAAAEIVTTPSRAEVHDMARRLAGEARDAIAGRLGDARERIERARGRYGFRRADDLVAALAQTVDGLAERLARGLDVRLRQARGDVRSLAGRVHPGRLRERVAGLSRHRGVLAQRLALARSSALGVRRQRVAAARDRLAALSPRAVLARGYSLVTLADGAVVVDASQLRPGGAIGLEFARGRAAAHVTSIAPASGARQEEA